MDNLQELELQRIRESIRHTQELHEQTLRHNEERHKLEIEKLQLEIRMLKKSDEKLRFLKLNKNNYFIFKFFIVYLMTKPIEISVD